ncbi:hypothetical protein GQ600_22265 [Phytophthora cactorum]|nr:hypothetical protein GQ600_22265 [Phytophthora cactorum]
MSAAFHVEFWESSPTKTHKTILQQTLDALVCCIEEHDGAFEIAADVATLIGRVFALYSWTALLTVNFVVCGAGASLFPTRARSEINNTSPRGGREGVPALSARVWTECSREESCSERQTAGQAQDLTLAVDNATEEDAPLKYLNDHYQELMSRARSAGPSVSGTGAGQTGRRGTPALSASRSSTQEAGNDGDDLARALTAYVGYKANEEARRSDRVVRAAAAREYDESRTILEQSWRRRDSGSSEDFLAQLESELHADISSEQGEPATTVLTTRNKTNVGIERTEHREKKSSAVSEVSEADSDALADLERELEQSVELNLVHAVTLENARPKAKRARKVDISGGKTTTRVTASARESSAAYEIRLRRSSRLSSVASEADSNALEELERELSATTATLGSAMLPSAPSPTKTRSRKRNVKPSPVQRSTRNNAKKQRPNEMDTSTAAAAKQRASKSGPKAPQQPSRMSFTITVVQRKRSPGSRAQPEFYKEEEVACLAEGCAISFGPVALNGSTSCSRPVADVGLRRSARLSSLASDTESDGTTRRQQTRAQGTKSKQSQAKEGPKATRTPRAPQAKQKRAAVETEVAKPSTRQPLVAPVSVSALQSRLVAKVNPWGREMMLRRRKASTLHGASALACTDNRDLPNVERVILSHIETIQSFTAAMPSWTLQWEGMHWWMLQNATPLFVASAYSRPDIVHWLLLKERIDQPLATSSRLQCRSLASVAHTQLSLPSPPTNEVAFSSSYSAEVVITPTGSSQTNSIQQTVYKCLLRVSWQTPLSNGAMIGKYELRYRRLVTEDGSEASSDQEDDKEETSSGQHHRHVALGAGGAQPQVSSAECTHRRSTVQHSL